MVNRLVLVLEVYTLHLLSLPIGRLGGTLC